jgi:monoamine oxidase
MLVVAIMNSRAGTIAAIFALVEGKMQSPDTIIIGAGAAGLMAARVLKRAGKEVLILEASNRIGGRILTHTNTSAGVPVELGAEFVHGEAPETTKLLDEARLVTVPVSGQHYRADRGQFSQQGQAWQKMKLVFRHMNPNRREDRSFQEFLDEKPGGTALRNERELALGFVQGFNGAYPSLISEKSLADQGDPTEGAAEARRIIDGYSSLMDYLRRDVEDSLRMRSQVRRVIWNDSHVRVADQNGRQYGAQTVIITVPLPALQDDSISFEPEIPLLRTAAKKLQMGQVVHLGIVVNERFWERKAENISYIHTPLRPFNVWWTQNPLKAPLIVGWSGGPPAVALSENDDIEDVALRELARALGMRRNQIDKQVDSIHHHDWRKDKYIRGAYSYAGVGGAHAARSLARSFGKTLLVAGEATNSATSGTVEGALASGKRAAEKAIELMS